MRSNYYNTLEPEEVDFLGGASQIPYTMYWLQSYSDITRGKLLFPSPIIDLSSAQETCVRVSISHDEITELFEQLIKNVNSGDFPVQLLQSLCQILITYIPAQGLLELVETMKEIYEFHRPIKQDIVPYSMVIETLDAEDGETFTRPEFHLDEDEV